jgi:hypothetical protein
MKTPIMKMFRLLLILCFTSGLTLSSFARQDLSQVLVGTWLGLTRTGNAFETTFNADGSYVGVSDLRPTGGRKLVEEGKWSIEGDLLYLTSDSHPKSNGHPYAKVIFDPAIPLTSLPDESRNIDGGPCIRLEDKSDIWKWENGDQKAVPTGYYQKHNPDDFVCAEESALTQQEANAAAIVAQRSARSVDVKSDPVPVTAIIRGSSVERINAASGAYLGGIAVNGTPVDVGCDGETIAVLTSNGSVDRWNAQTGEYRGGVAVQGDIESIQVTGGVLIVRSANSISRFDARTGAYKGGGGL